MSRTLTDADRERLRELARCAFEDEREPTASVALSPSGVALALALDPETVLALVTDVSMLRGQLTRMRERWSEHANQYDPYPDLGMPVYAQDHYAAGVARCADELQRWLGGDPTVFDEPMPPYEESDDDEEDDDG